MNDSKLPLTNRLNPCKSSIDSWPRSRRLHLEGLHLDPCRCQQQTRSDHLGEMSHLNLQKLCSCSICICEIFLAMHKKGVKNPAKIKTAEVVPSPSPSFSSSFALSPFSSRKSVKTPSQEQSVSGCRYMVLNQIKMMQWSLASPSWSTPTARSQALVPHHCQFSKESKAGRGSGEIWEVANMASTAPSKMACDSCKVLRTRRVLLESHGAGFQCKSANETWRSKFLCSACKACLQTLNRFLQTSIPPPSTLEDFTAWRRVPMGTRLPMTVIGSGVTLVTCCWFYHWRWKPITEPLASEPLVFVPAARSPA